MAESAGVEETTAAQLVVPLTCLITICDSVGIDPNSVSSVYITPSEVIFRVFTDTESLTGEVRSSGTDSLSFQVDRNQ